MKKRKVLVFLAIPIILVLVWSVFRWLWKPTDCQGYVGDERRACKLVYRLHNRWDLRWDGTIGGLSVWISSHAVRAKAIEVDITPFLLSALRDKNRFAIAHVLLSDMYEMFIDRGSGSSYNGLKVQLRGNCKVTYEGNDLDALHQRWVKKLSK